MKKIFALLMVICVMVILGCSKDKRETLYIYNWTYYIPDQVVKAFEAKYNVRVVYDVFSSNEEMFAKLKAGGKGYDIVFPSGDFVKIMIKEKMLLEIDKSKIPNFQYLDKKILSRIKYDTDNKYSVPYMMGTAGIAVNKAKVKDYEHSANIYGRTDLKGKMTLLDDMREVLGIALKELGYSVNTTSDKQLEEAKKLVMSWKENILKFDAESFGKGFASGEYWVVQGYAENIFLELDTENRKIVDFFIPRKGGTMYIDSMVILKDSNHIELAYKFIDFIHEPQIYAQIADFLRLPAINKEARKYIKQKPHYQTQDLERCEIKEELGEDLSKYNTIWEQVRI